jgi:hypothetical protein
MTEFSEVGLPLYGVLGSSLVGSPKDSKRSEKARARLDHPGRVLPDTQTQAKRGAEGGSVNIDAARLPKQAGWFCEC